MLKKYDTYTYKTVYIACQIVDMVRHTFINTRALPCQWAQYQYECTGVHAEPSPLHACMTHAYVDL